MKLLHNINVWLDKKLRDLKKEENRSELYKIDQDDIESKADWGNFYKNIRVTPRDLRRKWKFFT